MSFGLYAIGFAIVIGGLVYAAYLVHMPAHWIVSLRLSFDSVDGRFALR
jgi:hypothetical protein